LGCSLISVKHAPEEKKSNAEIEHEIEVKRNKEREEDEARHRAWCAKIAPIERAKNKAKREAATKRNSEAELVPLEETTEVGQRFKHHVNQGERDAFVRVIDGSIKLCQYYMPKGKGGMFTVDNDRQKKMSPSMLKRKKYKQWRESFKANAPDGYADWVEWYNIKEEEL
jgi:hypothetical protein